MPDFATFIVLTALLGLSIFISLPLILWRLMPGKWVTFLNAIAIGILIFLVADIFSDVAAINVTGVAYVTQFWLDVWFVLGFAIAFGVLYSIDNRAPAIAAAEEVGSLPLVNASHLALMIAIGMGFQNLTEGLLFGITWVTGGTSLLTVIFIGFFLQNITEGFPIGAPFMGTPERPAGRIVGYFLIGGLPTILGGIIGYELGFSNPSYLNPITVFIDAIAIGAIVYVLIPMIKAALRREDTAMGQYLKERLVYMGILAGFILGFVVNAF